MSPTVLGVLAALIVMASFALRGEKKIRFVNLVGCVFLALYGASLKPVNLILVLMGAATAVVHCVQFWSMYKESRAAKAVAKAEARAEKAEGKAPKDEVETKKEDVTF